MNDQFICDFCLSPLARYYNRSYPPCPLLSPQGSARSNKAFRNVRFGPVARNFDHVSQSCPLLSTHKSTRNRPRLRNFRHKPFDRYHDRIYPPCPLFSLQGLLAVINPSATSALVRSPVILTILNCNYKVIRVHRREVGLK